MGVAIVSVVVGLVVYAVLSMVPWYIDDEKFLNGGYWPNERKKQDEEGTDDV